MDKTSIEEFATSLRGRVLQAGDDGYQQARSVWNGMIDRRPAVVAECSGAADVILAVRFAREQGLHATVKAGGHNVAGRAVCDQGLVIDVSPMNSVVVDPHARRARVGPGATWGDFDHEAQAFGLATTGGVDSRTGVAGLTLGGGIGYLARRFGLAIDNLVSADVVTAEGQLVRASEGENADLFWALRGGGGNTGVVITSFEFRLHQVGPRVMTAQVFHPFEAAGAALRFYRDFTESAPDELACYAMIIHLPPVPPFPEDLHGKPALALVACHSGDPAEGEKLLAPLKGFGNPILAAVQGVPYTALQQSFDAGTPDGQRYYYKSKYLEELSNEAVDTLIARVGRLPGQFSVIGIEPMAGAIARVDTSATAYPHRNAAYNLSVWAGWSDSADDEEIIAWARDFDKAMSPHATGGVYVNYLGADDDDRLESAYGKNYERLRTVRAKFDPNGLFDSGRRPVAAADIS